MIPDRTDVDAKEFTGLEQYDEDRALNEFQDAYNIKTEHDAIEKRFGFTRYWDIADSNSRATSWSTANGGLSFLQQFRARNGRNFLFAGDKAGTIFKDDSPSDKPATDGKIGPIIFPSDKADGFVRSVQNSICATSAATGNSVVDNSSIDVGYTAAGVPTVIFEHYRGFAAFDARKFSGLIPGRLKLRFVVSDVGATISSITPGLISVYGPIAADIMTTSLWDSGTLLGTIDVPVGIAVGNILEFIYSSNISLNPSGLSMFRLQANWECQGGVDGDNFTLKLRSKDTETASSPSPLFCCVIR